MTDATDATDATIDPMHVSASFGDRKPPYSNWHYTCAEYETASGKTRTARSASTLRSLAMWHNAAQHRIGQTIGFGPYNGETITGYELITTEYKPDPQGRKVRIKDGAAGLLIRHLNNDGRHPSAGFSRDEQTSIAWLEENKGRVFDLAATSPQMTNAQFYNTMPTDDSEGGFFLPRGLCAELKAMRQD